jgi:hypothetical protein
MAPALRAQRILLDNMLSVLHADQDYLHYRVSEKVTPEDIDTLFEAINPLYRTYGKVNLLSEVPHFGGYDGWRAVMKVLRNEPTLMWKARKYALVTDDRRLHRLFRLGSALVIRPRVRIYSLSQLREAKTWLTN